MTRNYGALLLAVAAASCMTEGAPETDTAAQEATVAGGHFPNAVMPQQPYWTGAALTPLAAAEEIVMFPDSSGTFWHALVANPSTGKVTSAYKIDNGKVQGFITAGGAAGGNYPRIDIIRVPPQPPPGGNDWLARFGLETALDHNGIALRAYNLSKPL